MKKFISGFIIVILLAMVLGGLSDRCEGGRTEDTDNGTVEETVAEVEENDSDCGIQSQFDLNYESYYNSQEYYKVVEGQSKELIALYPEYKNLFERENKKWKRYYDVVNKVAGFMDLGSGSPLYINELVNLSIRLREISLQPMILHAQGTKVYFSRTVFTSAMIEEAYEAFIKVEDKNEDLEGIDDYLNLLVKEQQCWNDWMAYRESIAAELPSDLKRFYDNCTNMVRREKLLQLKNQYQGLGMTSSEVWSCVLPDSCSDRALLEYPGFEVVWAKHLQDPDWYPSFHSEESVIETMIKSFEEDSYTEEEAAHWDSMNNEGEYMLVRGAERNLDTIVNHIHLVFIKEK